MKHNSNMGDFRVKAIPEELHRRLKALAALEGLSMNELIVKILRDAVEKMKGRL